MITGKFNRGFTLIEVLLASAIFAVISLATFAIFDGVTKAQRGAEEKQARLNEIQRAWLTIERDFLQISHRTIRLEGEAPTERFITASNSTFGDEQVVMFTRGGWSNPGLLIPRSDMQSVAYVLQDNTLIRLHYNFVDAVVGETPKSRALIKEVEAFSLRFFIDSKWQTALASDQVPQAIEFSITTSDLATLSKKFLLVDAIGQSSRLQQQDTTPSPNEQSNGQGRSSTTNGAGDD